MNRQIVNLLLPHDVYASTKEVLHKTTNELGLENVDFPQGNKKTIYRSKTKQFGYASLKLKKENVYLADSPLACLETWELLLKNIPCVIVEEYNPKKGLKNFVAGTALRLFASKPFITLTKRTHSFLKELGAAPLLVPPAVKKKRITKNREHILFVGRATPSKNPLFFIRLAQVMKDEEFVLIGKGEMSAEIAKRAESVKNLEYISFVEDKDQLFDYYARSKLLVHPALRDPVGFAIIEALGNSTPVIASSGTGASDFLPERWVMKGFDETSWCKKIREVLDNFEGNSEFAGETFEKEHLNIEDPYFDTVGEELNKELKRKWPGLWDSSVKNP